jgi:hypothetical protein
MQLRLFSIIKVLLLVSVLLSAMPSIFGQPASLSDSVTIELPASSLENALRKTAMHTGITFAYRSALLKGKSMASVKFNGTIEQLLIKINSAF